MANPSIYAAFERLWYHIINKFNNYYTEVEVDEKIAESAAAVKSDLLNGAGEAYDTLKELGELIDENTTALDALETVANGKQDKITGTAGQFVVIGSNGNITTKTIAYAEEASF